MTILNRRFFSFGMALCLVPLSALAQSPQPYFHRAAILDREIDAVITDFDAHIRNSQLRSIDERLAEGITLQSSGDQERAAYVFMDIVSRDEWRSAPAYQTAKLLLARSLYERGYYRLCQNHLLELLANHATTERNDAMALLLLTAQRTGDWTAVNDILSQFSDTATSPAHRYIMGRARFLQEKDLEARQLLELVSGDAEWMFKADYMLGVLDIRAGELWRAFERFQRIANDETRFRGSETVHNLAKLAVARLHYELEQWSQALDSYQKIPESSPYFAEVLYEMAWTQIRIEKYKEAQQSFEILLLSYPEHRHAQETRRLMADIQRELGNYDEALTTYQEIVDNYEPVLEEMSVSTGEIAQRTEQIKKAIEAGQFTKVKIVPDRARGIVDLGTDIKRVESNLSGLSQSDVNTNESQQLIDEINAILNSPTGISSLPEFKRFSERRRDLMIRALVLGSDISKAYNKLPQEAADLAKALATLDSSEADRDILRSKHNTAVSEREGRLHKLKLESESIRYRMQIIRDWLDKASPNELSADERLELKGLLTTLDAGLEQLKSKQARVSSKLNVVRSSDVISQEELDVMQASIERLESSLENQWRVDQSDADNDYDKLITKTRTMLAKLDKFKFNIDQSIEEKSRELRGRLAHEVELVAASRISYEDAKVEVGETAGDVAARYWQTIYQEIRKLLMNADLGMVDIAWLLKNERSKELSQTMDERKREREILEQDYKQFLKESGNE